MGNRSPSQLRHRRIFLISVQTSVIVLLCLLLASPVYSATGTTYTAEVDTLVDSNAHEYQQCTLFNDEDCSLRGAIIAANAASKANTYHLDLPAGKIVFNIPGQDEEDAYTGDLDIKNNIEIHGNAGGTIIDANGLDRVIDHVGSGVTLKIDHVTITGGALSSGGGAGIRSTSTGDLTILSSTIIENDITGTTFATDKGGGLYDTGGTLQLDATWISSNTACDAGGVYLLGSTAANFSMDSVTIFDNEALCEGSTGGLSTSGSMTLEMVDTSIGTNTGLVTGGMYISSSVTSSMDGGSVTNNTATGDESISGAGGMMLYGSGTIRNILISSNRNIARPVGGVNFGSPSNYLVEDVNILANEALTSNAGGAYVFGTVTFKRVTFAGNLSNNGAGVFLFNAVANFENCTIANNTAYQDGGALFAFGDHVITLSHTTIHANNHAGGAAVYVADAPITFKNSIFSDVSVGFTCGLHSGATVISEGYNIATDESCGIHAVGDLSSTDPLLSNLNFAGPATMVRVVPLLAGSPAIDSAQPDDPLLYDQRGMPRIDGDGDGYVDSDRGSFEYYYLFYLPLISK